MLDQLYIYSKDECPGISVTVDGISFSLMLITEFYIMMHCHSTLQLSDKTGVSPVIPEKQEMYFSSSPIS